MVLIQRIKKQRKKDNPVTGGAARVVLISIGVENCPSPELFDDEMRNL